MRCCFINLKVLVFICSLGFAFTSCEDDAIVAPKGQQAAGSYGRMSFPDSTNAPVFISNDNPEIF